MENSQKNTVEAQHRDEVHGNSNNTHTVHVSSQVVIPETTSNNVIRVELPATQNIQDERIAQTPHQNKMNKIVMPSIIRLKSTHIKGLAKCRKKMGDVWVSIKSNVPVLLRSMWCRMKKSMLAGWWQHFWKSFSSPEGYQMLGKALLTVGSAFGILVAILTYQFQNRISMIDNAERSFTRLADDIGSTTEQRRIASLSRVPVMMTRQVPDSVRINVVDGVREVLSGRMHTHALYADEVKHLVQTFMKRGVPVTLEELQARSMRPLHEKKNRTENVASMLSPDKSEAVVDMLTTIRPESWYGVGQPKRSETSRNGLAWVWSKPLQSVRNKYDNPAQLFERTRFAKLNLEYYNLVGASFQRSYVEGGLFKGANLQNSTFALSILDDADFSNARLTNAIFEHSSLVEAYLVDTILTNADFRNCDLRMTRLRGSRIDGAKFFNACFDDADLSNVHADSDEHPLGVGAFFLNASFQNAFLQMAHLQFSDFKGANLDGANFQNALLDDANLSFISARYVNFSFTSLRGANFEFADLSGANFHNVRSLDKIQSCFDANIANAAGLSQIAKRNLFDKGAVSISDPQQWKNYKNDGRPHRFWQKYATINTFYSRHIDDK